MEDRIIEKFVGPIRRVGNAEEAIRCFLHLAGRRIEPSLKRGGQVHVGWDFRHECLEFAMTYAPVEIHPEKKLPTWSESVSCGMIDGTGFWSNGALLIKHRFEGDAVFGKPAEWDDIMSAGAVPLSQWVVYHPSLAPNPVLVLGDGGTQQLFVDVRYCDVVHTYFPESAMTVRWSLNQVVFIRERESVALVKPLVFWDRTKKALMDRLIAAGRTGRTYESCRY